MYVLTNSIRYHDPLVCTSPCFTVIQMFQWLYSHLHWWNTHTVWPEILAGRYFGGLLKICHLAEFTLAVEPVLAIMIFIAKWLIKRAGNLTRPCASCNWKLNKSLLRLIWTVFVPSVFTATMYTSFASPSSHWQTCQLFSVYKTL